MLYNICDVSKTWIFKSWGVKSVTVVSQTTISCLKKCPKTRAPPLIITIPLPPRRVAAAFIIFGPL